MVYTRGRPQDWDRISADGNYGWYVIILIFFVSRVVSDFEEYHPSNNGMSLKGFADILKARRWILAIVLVNYYALQDIPQSLEKVGTEFRKIVRKSNTTV